MTYVLRTLIELNQLLILNTLDYFALVSLFQRVLIETFQ